MLPCFSLSVTSEMILVFITMFFLKCQCTFVTDCSKHPCTLVIAHPYMGRDAEVQEAFWTSEWYLFEIKSQKTMLIRMATFSPLTYSSQQWIKEY